VQFNGKKTIQHTCHLGPINTSDHQTGLGFDVISWAWRDSRLNAGFAQTGEAQWMAAHCADYGFIVRYPEGKEEITGIIFEPWHLRYVGAEVAQYMTGFALTLEEFTVEWKSALVEYGAQSGRSQPADDGGGKPADDSFSF
jgi:LAS superfamily LD-carboxypeptidase LdcB